MPGGSPHFDYHFSESSFGFRPNRSAHGAIRRVKSFIKEGRKIAVDADLSKFFDRVSHDVLMARVSRRIDDKRVLKLIGKYLRAGVVINNRLQATPLGVTQGGPLSPLLANIILDDLDKELESFYGLQDDETSTVYSGMDKLLWNCRVLSSYSGYRRVDSPQGSYVLLETVALCQNQSAESPETRYKQAARNSIRFEP